MLDLFSLVISYRYDIFQTVSDSDYALYNFVHL